MRKILVFTLLCFAILAVENFVNSANVSANSNIVNNKMDLQFQPLTTGSYFWGTIVNCNEWVSLRRAPFVSEERICKVPLGADIIIYKGRRGMGSYSPENGFYYINYNGEWGWCLQQYIQIGSLIK